MAAFINTLVFIFMRHSEIPWGNLRASGSTPGSAAQARRKFRASLVQVCAQTRHHRCSLVRRMRCVSDRHKFWRKLRISERRGRKSSATLHALAALLDEPHPRHVVVAGRSGGESPQLFDEGPRRIKHVDFLRRFLNSRSPCAGLPELAPLRHTMRLAMKNGLYSPPPPCTLPRRTLGFRARALRNSRLMPNLLRSSEGAVRSAEGHAPQELSVAWKTPPAPPADRTVPSEQTT
jgi:hypothetical protein